MKEPNVIMACHNHKLTKVDLMQKYLKIIINQFTGYINMISSKLDYHTGATWNLSGCPWARRDYSSTFIK